MEMDVEGRWLLTAWRQPSMNRPGTDWAAWVIAWDLSTGERTHIWNAATPMAISPDGRWMLLTTFERKDSGGSDREPANSKLAVYRCGASEPAYELQSRAPASLPLGVAFAPDSLHIYGIYPDGRVDAWSVTNPGAPVSLGTVPGLNLPARPWAGRACSMWVDRDRFYFLFAGNGYSDVPPTVHAHAGIDRTAMCLIDPKAFSLERASLEEEISRSFVIWPGRVTAGAVLPPQLLSRQINQLVRYPRGGPRPFVRTPELMAWSQNGWVEVRELRGEAEGRAPTRGAFALTPDGSQVITDAGGGYLRFWEWRTGRLVRSLRIDDAPADTFVAAAIQCASEFGDPAANRERLKGLVQDAAWVGASVIVLPETAVTGYMSSDLARTWQTDGRRVSAGLEGVDPQGVAETIPGPSTQFFSKVVRDLGVYLTVPMLEVDPRTRRFYNSVVVLGPGGDIVSHYRKRDPWPWAEQGWATPGNLGHPVMDTPYGRLGTLICFDIHQQAAAMADLNIDTLLYSVAWVEDADSDWFAVRLPHIAQSNGFNIVAANWSVPSEGPPPQWHGFGQSRIIDAGGKVRAAANAYPKAGRGDEIVYAELPLTAPVLKDHEPRSSAAGREGPDRASPTHVRSLPTDHP
ncbi:MAG: Formamidase [Phycisphaerae bacterium]|nr:Formamidase [Phycisphaerae bacterium]